MTSSSDPPCCFEPHDSSLRKPLNLFSGLFLHSLHFFLSVKEKGKHRVAGFLTQSNIFTWNQELSSLTLLTCDPTLLHPPPITSASKKGSGSRSEGLGAAWNTSYLAFNAFIPSMALVPSTVAKHQPLQEELIPREQRKLDWWLITHMTDKPLNMSLCPLLCAEARGYYLADY